MKNIIELISKEVLTSSERLVLLEEIYWMNWSRLSKESPDTLGKIFTFLRNSEFNEEEKSLILKLYNNPDGAYIEEFSYIITKFYREDRTEFFKSLQLVPDELDNLAYLFRNKRIFEDGDVELEEIINTNKLTNDEKETTEAFFAMYKNLCNT